jgi:hypothetical protein
MKTKLTDSEKQSLLPHIREVIETRQKWEDGQLHYPVEAIVKAILEIEGMERKELDDSRYGIIGFNTNGWQWDWWQEFIHCGTRYTLSGSGYYGGHAFFLSDQ